ncbi:hypothetical protein SMSP2_02936 [Limihaloglobus sulfuriphilus]|uniref:Uncharacterized protein n=1 Tax=Limihaloglobus sulfuriphilus TaxID=1851148 RepID=A0A1R7T696_9BACT|nr:hypothetical protein [Limihaloglobus sulfuriphilus]AQQ72546.1 hypothetical protein SMSP2_02936 [Limihaloglobus sulfuriphilus]
MNKTVMIAIAVLCLAAAGIITYISVGGGTDGTKSKPIYLKCTECGKVVEMSVGEYEKKMKELTEGLSQLELMNTDTSLKCPDCSGRLQVGYKDPDTGEVVLIGN